MEDVDDNSKTEDIEGDNKEEQSDTNEKINESLPSLIKQAEAIGCNTGEGLSLFRSAEPGQVNQYYFLTYIHLVEQVRYWIDQ